ncbi:MAG: DUF2842 domain-containing protein [Alphaproteobacteria bacterium]|nr:MAG: DUF2842 domain-containing protein [Alphaproteobacteria bacterium]
MTPPLKRTFGMFILIVGLVFYAAGVVKLSSMFLPIHWLVDLVYYVIAGVAWVVPAGLLLKWAARGREDDEDDDIY